MYLEKVVKKTSLWKALLALAFFMAIQILINGNLIGVSRLIDITGGIGIPDLNFYYSAEDLYNLLHMQGEAGRQFYLTRILPLDFIFPISYTLFLLLAIALVLRGIFTKLPSKFFLFLVLLGGAADYLENICNGIVLLNYPKQMPLIPSLPGIFSSIKFSLIGFNYLILLSGIVVYLVSLVWKKMRA